MMGRANAGYLLFVTCKIAGGSITLGLVIYILSYILLSKDRDGVRSLKGAAHLPAPAA